MLTLIMYTVEQRLSRLVRDLSAHSDQIQAGHLLPHIGQEAGECRVVREQQESACRLIQPANRMQAFHLQGKHIENGLPALFVLMCRDHTFGFMEENKPRGTLLDRLIVQ